MARSALALVVAAILLATAQAKGFYYTYEDLASEDSMWALYERWVAHHKAHHKVVRDHGEMTRRFPTFKNRVLRKVSIHPNLARKKLGINVFGDMTDEEIIKFTSCNCWD